MDGWIFFFALECMDILAVKLIIDSIWTECDTIKLSFYIHIWNQDNMTLIDNMSNSSRRFSVQIWFMILI